LDHIWVLQIQEHLSVTHSNSRFKGQKILGLLRERILCWYSFSYFGF
jgi:hypothetical protein